MRSTGESLREYGRGVAGGLLFSLPLLYTVEVWHAGFTMPPHRQLVGCSCRERTVSTPTKNRLEWTVFAIGLVLVLATLGFLVRESIVAAGGPPEVVARLGEARPSEGGYLIPVEVANIGQTTAEDVLVPISLDLPTGGGRRPSSTSPSCRGTRSGTDG